MKKPFLVVMLSVVCAVFIFAQDNAPTPGPAANIASVAEIQTDDKPVGVEPVVVVEKEPLPVIVVEDEPLPVESVADPIPSVTDEIGFSDSDLLEPSFDANLISLSLEDVELQDVVRLFSRLSNANIIVPDMMDKDNPKLVDVNLDNVEWKPALQAILDTHGMELVEKMPGSEVYTIRERAADAPDPKVIKIFKLNYATVSEVSVMISSLVEGTGKVSIFPARNTIVIQSTPIVISEIEEIIAAIDLPREQVFIEAKFMELSDSASEKLGIDWQVLGGYGVGINGIGGSYNYSDSKTDSFSRSTTLGDNRFTDVSGRPYERISDDTEPTVPSTILDPEGDGVWVNGIDYSARPGSDGANASRIFGIIPTSSSEFLSTLSTTDESIVARTLGATLNASDFQLVLSALKELNGTKVVSNPKVIVANEEMASIHIGSQKPNIRGTIQTAGDSQSTTVYALDEKEPYFEDGIKVDVTPTINTLSNITVRIEPTLDRLDAIPTLAPDGTEYYGKSTKTINTLFSLEDGQTAAIGGLTEVTANDVSRKVPLLGDLPFIGRLFSYSEKLNRQVETIIFVTVGLANPDGINMETGLPEDSKLAMREQFTSRTDRELHLEKMKILKKREVKRLKEERTSLRAANNKSVENTDK